MNIRFIKATEADSRHRSFVESHANLLCVEIPNPTPETNKLAAAVDEEFGYFSEARLKRATRHYVLPFTYNGNVTALFYHPKIKDLVETKVAEYIASNTPKKS